MAKNCLKPEMNTNFCAHWQGDWKAKFCRTCTTQDTPCSQLWQAVLALAAKNTVLVNNKNGRAFGHKYQLDPPRRSPHLCYIQTLQGKRAYFGLPIEDFLYVTRTGLGRMYQTPSRTKQNPFVALILEQIASDPEIPGRCNAN
ncbi:MAG: hypothetical protein NWF00_06060 [Candidatus Bathyarchaeota archaeon]|nr:hypothetical protein [Candidatus Bathyarchaeota archaeon]